MAAFLMLAKPLIKSAMIENSLIDYFLRPLPILRLLLQWYSVQKMQVRWNSSLSAPFGVSNGMRQGGVLSPILFTVYLDDLLSSLKTLGVGCHWDDHFVGALCYADDIALLAPSPSALRAMLYHCEQFAAARGLLFIMLQKLN